jgi:RNA polymerase sigma factor (sigma-70 family)
MELTDEELIAGCRAGDDAAWETLIMRYRRLIYAIPRRAGLDEDAASEVFQQVFTLLVENLDRIKQPAQIQAWLVTTARREMLRIMKQNKNRRSQVLESDDETVDELGNLEDKNPLPDEVLMQLETQNKVRNAVESLDEKCRKLLEMLFYRQNSPPYSEIAAILQISEGSIGPTRARCLQKAMNKLTD